MAQANNYNKYKKYTKNKYKSKPLKNRASMLAMRTSTNIKNTKRTHSFAHRRWNLPFFCPCQISGFCFCHGRSFCQSVVFGCLLLFHFSGLIKIDCKQHIPLCIQSLTRVSGSLVEGSNALFPNAHKCAIVRRPWRMSLLKNQLKCVVTVETCLAHLRYKRWPAHNSSFSKSQKFKELVYCPAKCSL